MTSTFITKLAKSLTPAQKDLLKATPTRGEPGKQSQDGHGQLRYELKRLGLLTMTRPVKGNFHVWRTPTGDEVVEALKAKPRIRKVAPVQQVAA